MTADDGCELWTAVAGDGPPLVLCHGGPGLWDYFEDLAALLEARRVALSGAGHLPWAEDPDGFRRAVAEFR